MMATREQRERARQRVRDYQVRPIKTKAREYRVASISRPGKDHLVRVDGDRVLDCACEGFYFTSWCVHAEAVSELMILTAERVIPLCADCRLNDAAFGPAWYAGVLCHTCGAEAEAEQAAERRVG